MKVRLYGANTAFKAQARHPVHIDVADGFPRVPYDFCVNTNLVSTSPKNGATEVWLGTHNDVQYSLLTINSAGDDDPNPVITSHQRAERAKALGVSVNFADALVKERRKIRPLIQPSLPKGSLIIRDIRIWHASISNLTNDSRIMLVTVVFAHWFRSNQKLILPKRWQDNLQWGRLVPCVEWVENDRNYLLGSHDIDFTQLP